MKHYVLWGLIVAAFFLLSSCGSSKKIQEKKSDFHLYHAGCRPDQR